MSDGLIKQLYTDTRDFVEATGTQAEEDLWDRYGLLLLIPPAVKEKIRDIQKRPDTG